MKNSCFILLGMLILVGCSNPFQSIKGNGHVISQQRSVGNFSQLSAEGVVHVVIMQGISCKVAVEGDENLLPYILVQQEGNRLVVKNQKDVRLKPTKKITVFVTVPNLQLLESTGATAVLGRGKFMNNGPIRLEISGAGDIDFAVDAPSVSVEISGSGDLTLRGDTRDLSMEISGAGHANCDELRSENATVDVLGAGHATVFASQNIEADLSGAASVKYKGHPASVQVHKSGAADLQESQE